MRKLTLAYVQSQLTALQSELDALQTERREYMRKVRMVDRRIAKIKGGNFSETEETTFSERKSRNVGSRHHDKMLEVLRPFRDKQFTPNEIVEAYLNAGGTTDSQKPKDVLMQVLRKMPGIRRKNRGVYTYQPKGQ